MAYGKKRKARRRATASGASLSSVKSSIANAVAKKLSGTRKATRRRATATTPIPRHLMDHAQGILAPHSMKGGKIPDGTLAESHTLHHRIVEEVEIPANSVEHIVLVPGLDNPFIRKDAVKGFTPSGIESRSNNVSTGLSGTAVSVDGTAGENLLSVNGPIAKWRMVSSAMKLELLNTFEQNDGWFEAVRLNYRPDCRDFVLQDLTAQASANTVQVTINDAAVKFGVNFWTDRATMNLTEEKSYVTGPLRDIGKLIFPMTRDCSSNCAKTLSENYHLRETATDHSSGSTANGTAFAYTATLTQGRDDGKDMVNDFFDWDWDLLYIRLYAGASGSNVLLDHACMHEVVYDPATDLAKFMEKNPKGYPKMLQKLADIFAKYKDKAANVVSP